MNGFRFLKSKSKTIAVGGPLQAEHLIISALENIIWADNNFSPKWENLRAKHLEEATEKRARGKCLVRLPLNTPLTDCCITEIVFYILWIRRLLEVLRLCCIYHVKRYFHNLLFSVIYTRITVYVSLKCNNTSVALVKPTEIRFTFGYSQINQYFLASSHTVLLNNEGDYLFVRIFE